MTCSLAEEETRFVASRTGRGPVGEPALRQLELGCFDRALVGAPDGVPPADRLRAVLSVGTNRAP